MENNITFESPLPFTENDKSQIKILEVLHLCGNFFSGGLLSSILIALFLALQNDISANVRREAYNMINFNLSFILWIFISSLLILVIIGLILLPFFLICWLIFMIIGAIKHFAGERYTYPMTISFLK